ncbi:hypothetical protein ACETU7_13195 [Rhodococcus sp. 3Y1]
MADNAGLGKTLIAVMSAKTIAEERGETNILVLVDRPAQITIPHWRYSIASVGDGGFRWLIMSPDQLKKLIARNGRPKYTFGVVIADEAQLYSNDTQRTAAFEKVARFSNAHEQAPFVLSVTATPGHTPADQRYLAPLFAQLHSEPSSTGPTWAPGWSSPAFRWTSPTGSGRGAQRRRNHLRCNLARSRPCVGGCRTANRP